MQRPIVSIQSINAPEQSKQVKLPLVFLAPIRPDLVNMVHYNLSRNSQQPHAVSSHAGEQTSAISWGTGRAVSRIPRVSGGGTHASGQGALGNMCRGGRMFAPSKIWRRWHRHVNLKQRKYAIMSSLAASAVPALVMARGHRVENVPELPLVVSTEDVNQLNKTKSAMALMKQLGLEDEINRVKDSWKVRSGHGRHRNRRFVHRRGPLVIYSSEDDVALAFRNILGVELLNVNSLNLLKLSPGGTVGRLIVWTENAFLKLDKLYGMRFDVQKARSFIPRSMLTNSDITRIMKSTEIKQVLRPIAKPSVVHRHYNLLRNTKMAFKLNPYLKEVLEQRRKKVTSSHDEQHQ